MIPLRTSKLQKLLVSSYLMALSGPVCVCVNPAITCRHKLIYIRTLTLEVKAEQGATAPFISPWPTKLLMFGEDMQSDQLHVPANRTVDFCSSMTLFALRKNFTFRTVSSITCTSSFWFSELVREPSCIALTWHRACSGAFMYCAGMALSSFGNLHVLRWHGTELIGDLSCCIGVALSYSLEIFI